MYRNAKNSAVDTQLLVSADPVPVRGYEGNFASTVSQNTARRKFGRRRRFTNSRGPDQRIDTPNIDDVTLGINRLERTIRTILYPDQRLRGIELTWQFGEQFARQSRREAGIEHLAQYFRFNRFRTRTLPPRCTCQVLLEQFAQRADLVHHLGGNNFSLWLCRDRCLNGGTIKLWC